MARKKNELEIQTLGKDIDKLLVQKSKPLSALWHSDLTLQEFKILDTYLARIDSHKPEQKTVIFSKKELEQLLDVKKINTEDLKLRLKHLVGNVVEVPNIELNEENGEFLLVTLFEEAKVVQDEFEQWKIYLECTEKAMKYFFNIENLGYLRYKLRCITSLTSRYSYIMFLYLEVNRFRKTWEIGVDELRNILNCENEEYYKQYKRFNDSVLKRIYKELNEKTECKYEYESVKIGRKVAKIKFTVKTLPREFALKEDIDELREQAVIEDKELWETAFRDANNGIYEFNKTQLEEIKQILLTVPKWKMPEYTIIPEDIDMTRYHYIAQKYAALNRQDQEGVIKNRYKYFLKMLKKDAELE
ncbi:replication protein [Lachnospiraceae bacterium TWA4]|nr:replication protein [Lachnospiraceae bacterium TWA4]